MSGETIVTVIGNLTADPELRFTAAGAAVANFTVASTPRTFDKNANEWVDQPALFLRCNIWREAAENVTESLVKGQRVIVSGRLRQRSFDTKEGDRRTVIELEVDEIGPSLRYATAKVTRANTTAYQQNDRQRPAQGRRQTAQAPADDPWGAAPPAGGSSGYDDEPPF